MTEEITEAPVARKRGRPPSAKPIRSTGRVGPRDESAVEYSPEGRVVAYSSMGERLTRKRTTSTDAFDIPLDIIPPGFSYQWNAIEVTGQPQTATMITMAENGWRPVPAGRHEGRFMPAGYSPEGPIIRDGLRLEERPIELTREAQREERQKANALVQAQQEQLGLTKRMPDGFSRDNGRLRQMERAGTSREIAPAPDIARPVLPIDPAA